MDWLFGVQGKDFILLGGDRASVGNSIIKYQDSDHKIAKISDNQLMACVGESYDKKNFPKLVKANLELYFFKNDHRLTTDESAAYIRKELAEGIRSSPHQCNCLLAGYNNDGPKLYWIDYLGSYIKKCINELKTRFSINMANFDVFKISKDGIEDISNKFNKVH